MRRVDGLVVERRDDIDWLRLDRPERLNAFDWPLRDAIFDAIDESAGSDTRGLVLTGTGRGFCAGADVQGILQSDAELDGAERRRRLERCHDMMVALAELGKPTVAAVNGIAAGAGWGLALGTDVIVASTRARFVSPFVSIGLVPDLGAMHTLSRRVGVARARDLFLTRDRLSAAEAVEIGAVDHVVPHDRLLDAARDLILGLSPKRSAA